MNAANRNHSSRHWAAVLILAAGLAACGKGNAPAPATPAAGTASPTAAAQQAAAQQQAAALAALSEEELKKRGSAALREQRLYAPAGDNAMEYYIALRKKSNKPNASAESALIDLQPYAVIAAEQALTREDFVEAQRLHDLIAVADPQAPALGRIAEAISKGKQAATQRQQQQETTRVADAAKAAEAARLQALAEAQPAAAPPQPAPVTPPPAPVVRAPVQEAPVQAQAPRPAPTPAALTPVFAPQPSYPQAALNAGTAGEVVLSFTVNTDGSVSDLSVVSAKPRGIFDRAVRAAVARWRFQPIAAPQTVTRTFAFKP